MTASGTVGANGGGQPISDVHAELDYQMLVEQLPGAVYRAIPGARGAWSYVSPNRRLDRVTKESANERRLGTSSRDLATVAGVLYGTIGAIGAGMLAAAAPPLIASDAPGSRVALQTLADTVEGLWQWLEPVPFTVWAGGVARALRVHLARTEHLHTR